MKKNKVLMKAQKNDAIISENICIAKAKKKKDQQNFWIKFITKIYHNIVKEQSKWDHIIISESFSFSHQIFWA